MNWSFLMWFGIGLCCYFVGLFVFAVIKYNINKKKFKKEVKENVKEENQNAIDNAKE